MTKYNKVNTIDLYIDRGKSFENALLPPEYKCDKCIPN